MRYPSQTNTRCDIHANSNGPAIKIRDACFPAHPSSTVEDSAQPPHSARYSQTDRSLKLQKGKRRVESLQQHRTWSEFHSVRRVCTDIPITRCVGVLGELSPGRIILAHLSFFAFLGSADMNMSERWRILLSPAISTYHDSVKFSCASCESCRSTSALLPFARASLFVICDRDAAATPTLLPQTASLGRGKCELSEAARK